MRRAGPFEEHVRDAIRLNRERARAYATLTGGRSNLVFRRYILTEYAVLPAAAWFDRRARQYHAAGVPLLSSVFESMANVLPMFDGTLEPHADDGWSPPVQAIARRLGDAFRRSRFAAVARAADAELLLLAERPWRDCMLRHQLESIRRLATVAPRNITLAVDHGLPSPERLLSTFFRFHLQGVRLAPFLDRAALPLQLAGVPILARELPFIPAWPEAGAG